MTEDIGMIEKTSNNENNDSNLEYIKKLNQKLGHSVIVVNRLDYYANPLPLGAFSNAVAFILYGFYWCKVFNKDENNFLDKMLLIFGGIGQLTAGFLEFIKGRTFTTTFYLTYGFFCLSHYGINLFTIKDAPNDHRGLCAFYGAWMMVSLPITVSSIRTNLFYVLQCIAITAFFAIKCIGEGFQKEGLTRETAGIAEAISGFISLYICINQLINEAFRFPLLPSIPFQPDNEIDIIQDYRK
jgi:succinate-acetate transporter protein